MEWRRIVTMELSGRSGSCVNAAVDNPDYANNPGLYYFFANVSSVIRRDIWTRFPFPDVAFGEDQLWAKQVLEVGYKTAYCADSLVYHSHSYGPWDNFARHFDHAWGLMGNSSGRPREVGLKNCVSAAWRVARADLAFWYHQNGQSKAEVVRRWALPAMSWQLAGNVGLWLGERAGLLPYWLCRLLSFQERVKRG
jgi:rhamnosyltransferase